MPLTVEQFTQQLSSSGLMTEDGLRMWLKSESFEQWPADGEQLARVLIKHKKLTKHQAEQLYTGKGKSLVLGNYVVLDKLGQGGMGTVLKAEHKRMKRLVALKVISASAMKSPDAVKRFHREVEAAAKLTHPNIVDANDAKGTHFLVMEYVEGDDLSALVKKGGPLSLNAALDATLQAAARVGVRSQARRDSSRHQAGELAAQPRRHHQDSGYGPGADRIECTRPATGRADQHRRDHGDDRLHVSGASRRHQACRRSQQPDTLVWPQ